MQSLTLILLYILKCQLAHCSTIQTCDSLIYCQGDLLDTIQRSGIFNDSKTFVDMMQINPSSETLENFERLKQETNNNLTKSDIKKFVEDNFVLEGELEPWTPSDYNDSPAFLKQISNATVRNFAKTLVGIWPDLGRKIKKDVMGNPARHSLIFVPNGFIVPGGRFREIYYWDSYWIVKGLLISEMRQTARGMLENLLSLVERFGFVPNGNRVYYLNRSQPPLLTLMVGLYIDATNDLKWLNKHVFTLDKELKWWLANRTVTVKQDGVDYTLAHYGSLSGTPRPESYTEDIKTCGIFKEQMRKEDCYKDIKSGAESGWDFSSRWIFDSDGGIDGNLSDIQTRRVAPVDLNSILCGSFEELKKLFLKLGQIEKATEWGEIADQWKSSILMIFYNDPDGIWYDYDIHLSRQRKMFFPSNLAPFWTEAYDPYCGEKYGAYAVKYLRKHGIHDYRGGIPTSLKKTGQQWDFPNAWPPLQDIVILGLLKSRDRDAKAMAEDFFVRWIDATIRGYHASKKIFEKYDAVKPGQYGGGGEYSVQTGFGWTNGVVLSLINEFFGNPKSK